MISIEEQERINGIRRTQIQLIDLKREAEDILSDIKQLKSILKSGLCVDNHIVSEGKYNIAVSNNEKLIPDITTAINSVSNQL